MQNKKYKIQNRYSLFATRYSRGFTLIELLVTIGIIVLILAVGTPAFRGFGLRNELDFAAQNIKGAVIDAQNYTLAPRSEKPSNIDIYTVNIGVADSKKFSVNEGSLVLKDFNLPQNVTFVSSSIIIPFSISGKGKIIYSEDTIPDVVIEHNKLSSGQNRRTIKIIKETGQVEIVK